MSEVVVIHHVRYVTCRPCSECERALKGERIRVAVTTVKRLSFGVGTFCSVRCVMKFAERKRRAKQDSVRGWAFGEVRKGRNKT